MIPVRNNCSQGWRIWNIIVANIHHGTSCPFFLTKMEKNTWHELPCVLFSLAVFSSTHTFPWPLRRNKNTVLFLLKFKSYFAFLVIPSSVNLLSQHFPRIISFKLIPKISITTCTSLQTWELISQRPPLHFTIFLHQPKFLFNLFQSWRLYLKPSG
jgi:hypothetical protein